MSKYSVNKKFRYDAQSDVYDMTAEAFLNALDQLVPLHEGMDISQLHFTVQATKRPQQGCLDVRVTSTPRRGLKLDE